MPRGGERAGRPGGQYPNRSDLNNQARTAGQPVYGEAKQKAAITAVPDGPPPSGPLLPEPGQLTSLEAPSARPEEPVTAGLDIGAGPGSEILDPAPVFHDDLFDVRAMAARFPEYASTFARLIALGEDQL